MRYLYFSNLKSGILNNMRVPYLNNFQNVRPMKKLTIYAIAFLMAFSISHVSLHAQHAEPPNMLEFFVGDWEMATNVATLIHKPLFVYVYTSYKPDCRKMERDVFSNKQVVKYYDDAFVNLKVNLNSEEGMEFKKKFNLPLGLTLLYFNEEGELLTDVRGYKSVSDLLALGKSAKIKSETPIDANVPAMYIDYINLKMQYQNGVTEPDFLYDFCYELKHFNDPYKHVVEQYMGSEGFAYPTTIRNLQFIFDFADDIHSKPFDMLVRNKHHYSGYYSREVLDERIKGAVRKEVVTAATEKRYGDLKKALAVIDKVNIPNPNDFRLEMEALYYEKIGNWTEYIDLVTNRLNNTEVESLDIMDFFAWKFAANVNSKDGLIDALRWSKKLINSKPNNYHYRETYAAVLYRLNKRSKALKECEMAEKIARNQRSNNYTTTLELLDVIRESRTLPKKLKYTNGSYQ